MKRQTMIFLAGILLLCFGLGTAMAGPITLRFAHQNPDTGLSSLQCVEPWLKQVEEATDGKVQIQAYYGQTLAKGKDMWSAVKSGITDIGWCFHGYWPGLTPLSDVISLPALPFRTAEKGSEVLWKLYERFPAIQEEYQDVKVLLFYTSEPYTLITREKPVKTLADIQGMKIRMTGGPPTDMMRALGGTPMLIPMPDCYISLQKGVIDGMGAPWEAIHVWRFHEVVDYYTEVPFPAVYFSITMNKNRWNSLSPDIQKAIMSVSGLKGSKFWGRNFFDKMKETGIQKVKSQGAGDNILELSQKQQEKWLKKGGKPVWKQWVKTMESKGHENAQAILDATLELSRE